MVNYQDFKFIGTYYVAGAIREVVLKNPPEEHLVDFFRIDAEFIQKALKPCKTPILLDFIEEKVYSWSDDGWRKAYEIEDWEELLHGYGISFLMRPQITNQEF